jgi:hypothetical protein
MMLSPLLKNAMLCQDEHVLLMMIGKGGQQLSAFITGVPSIQ